MKKTFLVHLVGVVMLLGGVSCGGSGGGTPGGAVANESGGVTGEFLKSSVQDEDVTDAKKPTDLPSFKLADKDVGRISCGSHDNTVNGYMQIDCLITHESAYAGCVNGNLVVGMDRDDEAYLYECSTLEIICTEAGTFEVDASAKAGCVTPKALTDGGANPSDDESLAPDEDAAEEPAEEVSDDKLIDA